MTNFSTPSQIDTSMLHDIWKYDILHISGNDIKVGNIIISVILLFLGIKLSKKITKFIVKIVAQKLHEDKDTTHTIERLVSYTLFLLNIFIALQIANIPLGVFTFIGGAFAIGLGLGAQGIVANFINTIIIMLEKPVKIGDVIEVQDVIGRVKSIGTRCITVDSPHSEEILIPNSIIMQNKLLKWTHNHNKTSYHIYINIVKENNAKINHKLIIKQLKLVAKDLGDELDNVEHEIYLTKIAKTEYQFCFSFICSVNFNNSAKTIKNSLNLFLLKHLQNDFTVEYSKNLG